MTGVTNMALVLAFRGWAEQEKAPWQYFHGIELEE
jgi:hypothetical protein